MRSIVPLANNVWRKRGNERLNGAKASNVGHGHEHILETTFDPACQSDGNIVFLNILKMTRCLQYETVDETSNIETCHGRRSETKVNFDEISRRSSVWEYV